MTDTDEIRAILGRALRLEQEGYAFYIKAADRVEDAECKSTMLSLAEDEQMHEAMIVRQLEAMSEEGSFVILPTVEETDVDLSVEIFPPDPDKADLSVDSKADELQALTMAMDFEVRSYDLYRNAAMETQSEAGRQMYEWLAQAEMQHFNLLMSNYEAINRRAPWS